MSKTKRVISIFLLLMLSLSVFFACGPDIDPIVTIKEQPFRVEEYLVLQLDAYNTMAKQMSYTFNQEKDDGTYLTIKEQMELYNNIDGTRVDVWITATTLEELRKVIYYDKALADAGITITEAEIAQTKAYAKNFYDAYEAYYNGYYTRNGVDQAAVEFWLLNSLKETTLFKSIYDTGGTKAVSEEDLKAHFSQMYASTKMFKIPYFNEASGVVLTEEEINNIEEFCKTSIEKLNGGQIDIDALYYNFLLANSLITEGTTVDPLTPQLFNLEDNDYATDMITAYKALAMGKAGYSKDANQGYFFIFLKGDPLSDSETNYTENRDAVLRDLKNTEFQDYIMTVTDSYDIQLNARLMKKYLPINIKKLSD